jgi:hypothetical protein
MLISFSRTVLATMVLSSWLLVSGSTLLAQERKNPAQQQQLPPVQFFGKVVGMKSGYLMVQTTEGDYYVQLVPQTKALVVGEADRSFLTTGMYIRFNCKLDKKGNAEDLSQLELFTPSDVARTGVLPEGGQDHFLVAGQIKSITTTGKLTVAVPVEPKSIKAQLPDDVKIKLAFNDPRACQHAKSGDEVTVSGRRQKQAAEKQPGAVIAEDIEIKLSEMLSGKKKGTPATKKPDEGKPDATKPTGAKGVEGKPDGAQPNASAEGAAPRAKPDAKPAKPGKQSD